VSALFRWLTSWWSRLLAGMALIAVAVATGIISYRHIYELSIVLDQPPLVARLQPVGIDGLIVIGSVVLLQATPNHPHLGWFGVVPGVAVSVFANFESGIAHGWLAASWASVPAGGFALATFLLERWLKSQVRVMVQGGSGGSAEPENHQDTEVVRAPAPPVVNQPEPPGPLTPEAALLALIGTTSRRAVADLLGVPKSRVDRWWATLSQPGEGGSEMDEEEAEDTPETGLETVGSLNGSAPGNEGEPGNE
jgi:hypothetical protein